MSGVWDSSLISLIRSELILDLQMSTFPMRRTKIAGENRPVAALVQALQIGGLPEVQDVHVRLVDCLHSAHPRVHSQRVRTVDSRHRHPEIRLVSLIADLLHNERNFTHSKVSCDFHL